jgi:hypothetical protein
MSKIIAPDVGTIVEYNGASYRVDAWMRVKKPVPTVEQIFETRVPSLNEVIDSILYETAYHRNGDRFEWCTRENATHLSLSGIAGALAKIEDCKITGRVNWTEEMIDELRQQALAFVGEMAD